VIFNEITNLDLILFSKNRQRHFETRAANVWELTHKSKLSLSD